MRLTKHWNCHLLFIERITSHIEISVQLNEYIQIYIQNIYRYIYRIYTDIYIQNIYRSQCSFLCQKMK